MKKTDIRSKYKLMRASLSLNDRVGCIEEIDKKFKTLFLKDIKLVHHYLAVSEQFEISIDGAIRHLRSIFPGITQAVPVMKKDDMIAVKYEDRMQVRINEWGIREPIEEFIISEIEVDCILTPLLAFDKHGNRVGYGKGCYDRFLAKCRSDAIKIGFSFFPPLERIEDTDNFDIPLNYCITPEHIYEFG